MEIDLNLLGQVDPLEVIINLANPLAADGFLEINDFIEEVEENIPQQMNPEPLVLNVVQVEDEVQNEVVPHIEGFPIPPLVDLIGEEILVELLIRIENEPEEAKQEAGESSRLVLVN